MEKTAHNTATEVCLSFAIAEQPSHMGLELWRDHLYLFYIGINKVLLSLQSPSSCSEMLDLVSRKIQEQRDKLLGSRTRSRAKG